MPLSVKWLKGLPREVRPLALATKYARIINLLAQHWNDHDACCAYLRTFLADRRGGRRGFRPEVRSDAYSGEIDR